MADAKRLEAEQNQRLQNIQGQIATLRAKEKQIAQVRTKDYRIYRDRWPHSGPKRNKQLR